MASEHRRRRRVRVITDPVKYRRHMRRKLLRLVVRVIVGVLAAVLVVVLFWLILDKMSRPRVEE